MFKPGILRANSRSCKRKLAANASQCHRRHIAILIPMTMFSPEKLVLKKSEVEIFCGLEDFA